MIRYNVPTSIGVLTRTSKRHNDERHYVAVTVYDVEQARATHPMNADLVHPTWHLTRAAAEKGSYPWCPIREVVDILPEHMEIR